MENSNKSVVIGVSGGIAAYKALDIVSALKKNNVDVHVIMTKNAMEFVSPLAFQSLSGNMVIVDMFAEPKAWEIQHISLAKKADLILVAPATANVIGKVAGGIADDMLTTTIMAAKCPIIFAPAMNTNMYDNPIVADNIKKLKNYGYSFIEPASGRLACGDIGRGKLADASLISGIVLTELYETKDLKGTKVLVTAGPTIAPVDPVRSIVNRSSGKMGYAIAEEARDRGAQVTLISGPTNLNIPHGVNYISVDTNEKMLNRVLENFIDSDIVIKAAAVADYKVKNYSTNKIKKQNDEISIDLIKDNDILKRLGTMKNKQILVGFAAESNDLIHYAKEKLENKNLDYIVANDITSSEYGFASNDNKVTVLCNNGDVIPFEKMTKRETAKEIFNLIIKRR
jgi:phosphopantothenoylcysteine decarboxylase / phosphopantothenate---cysteine ligase